MTALPSDWLGAEYAGSVPLLWPLTDGLTGNAALLPSSEGLQLSAPDATSTHNLVAVCPISLVGGTNNRLFVPVTYLTGSSYFMDIDLLQWGTGPSGRAVAEFTSGNLTFAGQDELGTNYGPTTIAYSPTSHYFVGFHWDGTNLNIETAPITGGFVSQLAIPNMSNFQAYFNFGIAFTNGGGASPASVVFPGMNIGNGIPLPAKAAQTNYCALMSILQNWAPSGSSSTIAADLARIIGDVERSF